MSALDYDTIVAWQEHVDKVLGHAPQSPICTACGSREFKQTLGATICTNCRKTHKEES